MEDMDNHLQSKASHLLSIYDLSNNFSDVSKQEYASLTLKSYNPINVYDDGYGYWTNYFPNVRMDPSHKYNINSHGYRDQEFIETTDILFAGCSHTYGIGIPEDMIWGNQLGKSLNRNVANISKPGASVQWIVQKIFSYFRELGHPNYVICLFPDFFRLLLPKENLLKNDNNVLNFVMLQGRTGFDDRPQYSKKPHKPEDIIHLDMPLYYAIQHIHMLEQYCLSNNINLLWSTWSPDTEKIIEFIQNKYNSFMNYKKNTFYPSFGYDSCHRELLDEYSYCFDRGTDTQLKFNEAHFGVHLHTHISEHFQNLIMGRNDNTWN